MKCCSTFSKATGLEPRQQVCLMPISLTLVSRWGQNPLLRCCPHILHLADLTSLMCDCKFSFVDVSALTCRISRIFFSNHNSLITVLTTLCLLNMNTNPTVCFIRYISSSSSSYRAGSTDIPDPLSPLLPIVHTP